MKSRVLLSLLILSIIMSCMSGCSKDLTSEVEIIDDGAMRVYKLQDSEPQYGMVLYVGTLTPPDYYDNIMTMVAKRDI